MVDQILVPLDGSTLATRGLPHVMALAQTLGLNLTLLRLLEEQAAIAATLHTLVDQADADLVVLSAQGEADQQQWSYGSIAASFIGHGTTPLLIMQNLLPYQREAECLSIDVQQPQLIHSNLVAELS
jgi:nucleotide-binding universal stress UspA family protein